MIALPRGCSVPFTITIEVADLTEEMIEWFEMAGGTVTEKEWYDHRGRHIVKKYVKYGKAKPCHYHQDGTNKTNQARIQFHGDDASTASIFILKFYDQILFTNLEEQMRRVAEGYTNI